MKRTGSERASLVYDAGNLKGLSKFSVHVGTHCMSTTVQQRWTGGDSGEFPATKCVFLSKDRLDDGSMQGNPIRGPLHTTFRTPPNYFLVSVTQSALDADRGMSYW